MNHTWPLLQGGVRDGEEVPLVPPYERVLKIVMPVAAIWHEPGKAPDPELLRRVSYQVYHRHAITMGSTGVTLHVWVWEGMHRDVAMKGIWNHMIVGGMQLATRKTLTITIEEDKP